MPTLADVVDVLDRLYDPAWAQDWDSVGLVCGDPAAPVGKVLLAIDPVATTVEQALTQGADLLLTHHPLLLRPVSSVAATTYKGRLLHRLISGGVALHTAHTNADVAQPGVSDALADLVGLAGTRALVPHPADPLDKLVTFVPEAGAAALVDALSAVGAGALGEYSRCAWLGTGIGTFLPGPGARPAVGRPGVVAELSETRIEMVLPRPLRAAVIQALRAAHPYQLPAYDIFELADLPSGRGFGRVGELTQPTTLADFAAHVAQVLPETPAGIRVSGEPDRLVSTVAVAGGAGDDHLQDAQRAGADVYLTADLRHHRASEQRQRGGPALIDAPHWATEQPWLPDVAARLRAALGDTVETVVSELVTDPWSLHLPSDPPAGPRPDRESTVS